MRILNITQCTNLGGMEQANLQRLEALRRAGHRVQVLSLNPLGPGAPLLAERGIAAEGLPYRGKGGWRSLPLMRAAVRRAACDAVIMTGHNLAASMALGAAAGKGRRLLAIHFHHTGVKPPWQWRMIYAVAVKRFQAITFPTDFIRQEAEALWAPVADVAHTVRDPLVLPDLPTPAERLAARRELGLDPDDRVVGNAGWLIPRKRFDVFLQVAARVATEEPRAVFLIAGDGPERDVLEKQAERLGIAGRVRWLGWQSNLRDFYRSLDVLLFNSDWDALGRTPLEALGHGVPVAASVVNGGLSEVLDRPQEVRIHKSHDIAALAGDVLDLLREPETGRGRAVSARARLAADSCSTRHAEILARLMKLEL